MQYQISSPQKSNIFYNDNNSFTFSYPQQQVIYNNLKPIQQDFSKTSQTINAVPTTNTSHTLLKHEGNFSNSPNNRQKIYNNLKHTNISSQIRPSYINQNDSAQFNLNTEDNGFNAMKQTHLIPSSSITTTSSIPVKIPYQPTYQHQSIDKVSSTLKGIDSSFPTSKETPLRQLVADNASKNMHSRSSFSLSDQKSSYPINNINNTHNILCRADEALRKSSQIGTGRSISPITPKSSTLSNSKIFQPDSRKESNVSLTPTVKSSIPTDSSRLIPKIDLKSQQNSYNILTKADDILKKSTILRSNLNQSPYRDDKSPRNIGKLNQIESLQFSPYSANRSPNKSPKLNKAFPDNTVNYVRTEPDFYYKHPVHNLVNKADETLRKSQLLSSRSRSNLSIKANENGRYSPALSKLINTPSPLGERRRFKTEGEEQPFFEQKNPAGLSSNPQKFNMRPSVSPLRASNMYARNYDVSPLKTTINDTKALMNIADKVLKNSSRSTSQIRSRNSPRDNSASDRSKQLTFTHDSYVKSPMSNQSSILRNFGMNISPSNSKLSRGNLDNLHETTMKNSQDFKRRNEEIKRGEELRRQRGSGISPKKVNEPIAGKDSTALNSKTLFDLNNNNQMNESFSMPRFNNDDKSKNLHYENYDLKDEKLVNFNGNNNLAVNNSKDKYDNFNSQKKPNSYEQILTRNKSIPSINKTGTENNNNLGSGLNMTSAQATSKARDINNYNNYGILNKNTSYENTQKNPSLGKAPGAPGVFMQKDEKKLCYIEEKYEDGARYIGDKLNDYKHGRGQYYYNDGSSYNGEWEMNKKSGYGILTSKDGKMIYDGEWLDDIYHGNGVLYNLNAEDLKNGKYIDYKDLNKVNKDWIKYEGEFFLGKRHGMGSLQLIGNNKFSGRFINDLAHGAGTFYLPDRNMITGDWENNNFIDDI